MLNFENDQITISNIGKYVKISKFYEVFSRKTQKRLVTYKTVIMKIFASLEIDCFLCVLRLSNLNQFKKWQTSWLHWKFLKTNILQDLRGIRKQLKAFRKYSYRSYNTHLYLSWIGRWWQNKKSQLRFTKTHCQIQKDYIIFSED